ncbi:hypothetical protein M9Y10_026914 [Tritrichomonas musculus]|uniref:DUF3447 domain-containing protein n=1 Tax=Tritrichomonas musculus TaxID=1915356 RepID=A0ABR2H6W5_9EUKA
MSIPSYIDKMKKIHKMILKYIKEGSETNLQSLSNEIENEKIINDKNEFKSFLHLICKISNNHYKSQSFHAKIEQILSFYRNQILNFFTNIEIFNIFKNNKRILLFLFDEKIIIFDQSIFQKVSNKKYAKFNYCQYFMPEINAFTKNNKDTSDETNLEEFKEKRKIGENELYICELIRNDSVEDFIAFINRNNISLHTKIKTSIYETNPFLIKNIEQSLIEYAAFFGSIQIFQYLLMNNINLTPSLWRYVIHGQNADLVHLLEDNHIECDIEKNIIESIKCHHNQFANYFMNSSQNNIENYISAVLKYYNFEYLENEFINEIYFFDFCKNDYLLFIPKLLPKVLINEVVNTKKEHKKIKIEIWSDELTSYEIITTIKIKKRTALHIAIEKENIEIVKILLTRKDIDINFYWKSKIESYLIDDKKTALHLAVEKSNVEIVKLLLLYQNIDVNCLTLAFKGPDLIEKTALQIAVENENAEIVKLLLSKPNIDVNKYMICNTLLRSCHRKEMTALCIAVEKDNIEITYLLCLHPYTNINIPFIQSCDSGEQCIPPRRILLEKKTPFQIATEHNNQTICQIILMKHLLPN